MALLSAAANQIVQMSTLGNLPNEPTVAKLDSVSIMAAVWSYLENQ